MRNRGYNFSRIIDGQDLRGIRIAAWKIRSYAGGFDHDFRQDADPENRESACSRQRVLLLNRVRLIKRFPGSPGRSVQPELPIISFKGVESLLIFSETQDNSAFVVLILPRKAGRRGPLPAPVRHSSVSDYPRSNQCRPACRNDHARRLKRMVLLLPSRLHRKLLQSLP